MITFLVVAALVLFFALLAACCLGRYERSLGPHDPDVILPPSAAMPGNWFGSHDGDHDGGDGDDCL